MKVTYQFCHIFQLKGIGGEDAGDPIFTISAAIRKGQLFLELRHWKGGDAPEEKFPLADLKSIKHQWMACDFVVAYGESGTFRFSLSNHDGRQVFARKWKDVNTWRNGLDFVRPKWGIYRSLAGNSEDLNEEDSVSFVNFLRISRSKNGVRGPQSHRVIK